MNRSVKLWVRWTDKGEQHVLGLPTTGHQLPRTEKSPSKTDIDINTNDLCLWPGYILSVTGQIRAGGGGRQVPNSLSGFFICNLNDIGGTNTDSDQQEQQQQPLKRPVAPAASGPSVPSLTMAMLRTNKGFPPPLFSCKTTSDPSGSSSASGCAAMIASPIMCRASTRHSAGDSGDISTVVPISRNVEKS